MKKIKFLLFLVLLPLISSFGQNVKCDDLIKYVRKEAKLYEYVSYAELYNSSYLYEVNAYKYKEVIFVIATFKTKDVFNPTKDYLFCNISEENWKAFSYKFNLEDKRTYGEKFQDFIMDNICECE